MISIDPDKLATAFLKPGTPMIAELLLRLKSDDGDLSDTRRRDLASGLRGIARAVNQSPETVAADLGWLQPRLEKVAPAALGDGQVVEQYPEQCKSCLGTLPACQAPRPAPRASLPRVAEPLVPAAGDDGAIDRCYHRQLRVLPERDRSLHPMP